MVQKTYGQASWVTTKKKTIELVTDMSSDYHSNDHRFENGDRHSMNLYKGDLGRVPVVASFKR